MQKDEPASAVPNHIPFPHAYLRVKEFLKKILKSLHDAHEAHKTNGTSQTCSCHPLIKVLDQDVLNRRLASQPVACWLGEAPFHGDLIDNDINEWLRNLALGSSPQCDVLVVSGCTCEFQASLTNSRCFFSASFLFLSTQCPMNAPIPQSPGSIQRFAVINTRKRSLT